MFMYAFVDPSPGLLYLNVPLWLLQAEEAGGKQFTHHSATKI
jgi:hypothetical protein